MRALVHVDRHAVVLTEAAVAHRDIAALPTGDFDGVVRAMREGAILHHDVLVLRIGTHHRHPWVRHDAQQELVVVAHGIQRAFGVVDKRIERGVHQRILIVVVEELQIAQHDIAIAVGAVVQRGEHVEHAAGEAAVLDGDEARVLQADREAVQVKAQSFHTHILGELHGVRGEKAVLVAVRRRIHTQDRHVAARTDQVYAALQFQRIPRNELITDAEDACGEVDGIACGCRVHRVG